MRGAVPLYGIMQAKPSCRAPCARGRCGGEHSGRGDRRAPHTRGDGARMMLKLYTRMEECPVHAGAQGADAALSNAMQRAPYARGRRGAPSELTDKIIGAPHTRGNGARTMLKLYTRMEECPVHAGWIEEPNTGDDADAPERPLRTRMARKEMGRAMRAQSKRPLRARMARAPVRPARRAGANVPAHEDGHTPSCRRPAT